MTHINSIMDWLFYEVPVEALDENTQIRRGRVAQLLTDGGSMHLVVVTDDGDRLTVHPEYVRPVYVQSGAAS